MSDRAVIFNADDFGASRGINRGIIQAHVEGVLTSASLMTTGAAAAEAAVLAGEHPGLSVGLHWDVWGEDDRDFDLGNEAAVREEFRRQLDDFFRIMDRPPTHVDSHKHAHLVDGVLPIICELVQPLRIPVRGAGEIQYIGGFYAQWEWQVTRLEHVSVEFLQRILDSEVNSAWTEIGCHPGFLTPDFHSTYGIEREAEVSTLTDPRIRHTMAALGLRLAGFADYPQS